MLLAVREANFEIMGPKVSAALLSFVIKHYWTFPKLAVLCIGLAFNLAFFWMTSPSILKLLIPAMGLMVVLGSLNAVPWPEVIFIWQSWLFLPIDTLIHFMIIAAPYFQLIVDCFSFEVVSSIRLQPLTD